MSEDPSPRIEYVWRDGSRFGADPRVIGKALDDLAARLGRPFEGLTAMDVVEEAEDPESPLHGLFEWDDAVAATEYRLEQSRLVLRSLEPKIVMEAREVRVIGRVAVKVEGESLYVKTSVAAREEMLRQQYVAAAAAGLRGWKARYAQLAGFDEVLAIIDQALAAIEKTMQPAPKPRRKTKHDRPEDRPQHFA